ncbi:alpha/beta fold hydrolase [Acinetobacter sp. NIPH 1869]|uniref:alpha/beta fold hydrolase n=1 Tax=Acinetobacter higginsii TaxID=70347 RepID=UPI001F4B7E82|nr:alpha/beta hydrolase [Acinetobacter higginsii]MCH7303775.1 alpha/beta fold hydrolase [Acinetobacter higginsii]
MNEVSTNNLYFHYDIFGAEHENTILLISGLGTQMIHWRDLFCQMLAKRGFRVIRFDNRDVGLSTHLHDQPAPELGDLIHATQNGENIKIAYTLHDMVKDTVGLLDALAIDQVHIIGRSMGGMIAQLMASTYPKRVKSLISIMSSTGNPALPSAQADVMALLTRPSPDPHLNKTDFFLHKLHFAKYISSPRFSFDENAYLKLISQEYDRNYDPDGLKRQIAAIAATGDIRSYLARIVAPTLVIHGTEDLLIPIACGQDSAKSISGAKLLKIEGMGHDLPTDLYQFIIDAIAAHIQQARHHQDQ